MTSSFGSLPLLSGNICDPSFQLSRLSCIDKNNFLVANADQLQLINVASHNPLILDEYVDSGNVSRCHSYTLNNTSALQYSAPSSRPATTEFQSLRLFNSHNQRHAAAITSRGDLMVCSLNQNKDTFLFGSPSYGSTLVGSQGYVGLCHAQDRNKLVSCHFLSKRLVWNDLNTLSVTRTSSLFRNPTCVVSTSLPSSSTSSATQSQEVVIVAEGGNIAVFDERQNSKGGCVFRENEINGTSVLWDILPLADQNRVAAAGILSNFSPFLQFLFSMSDFLALFCALTGSEKNIRIYDNRMWKTITKWRAPHKFDVVKLLPSSNNPLQLYVAGRDNEVLLCDLEPHLSTPSIGPKGSIINNSNKKKKQVPKKKMNQPENAASDNVASEDSSPSSKRQKVSADNDTATTTNTTGKVMSFTYLNITVCSIWQASCDVYECVMSICQGGDDAGEELLPMQLPTGSKLRISHHRGVRAEAMWAGLDVVTCGINSSINSGEVEGEETSTGSAAVVSDRLVGLCGNGKLYISDHANLMKLAI